MTIILSINTLNYRKLQFTKEQLIIISMAFLESIHLSI